MKVMCVLAKGDLFWQPILLVSFGTFYHVFQIHYFIGLVNNFYSQGDLNT